MFDVSSWRLRGKHATPRRRVQDYPRVNLTTRSPKLMETNDDKKPLQCQDSRSHVIRLCHQSRAPFFSAFYLYLKALDEKRRAQSTQHIKRPRPQQAERGFIACLQIMRTLISPPQNDILGPRWLHKKTLNNKNLFIGFRIAQRNVYNENLEKMSNQNCRWGLSSISWPGSPVVSSPQHQILSWPLLALRLFYRTLMLWFVFLVLTGNLWQLHLA